MILLGRPKPRDENNPFMYICKFSFANLSIVVISHTFPKISEFFVLKITWRWLGII